MTRQLILVPGFLCDRRIFEHQAAALADRSDVASVQVADVTRSSSIADMAHDVLADAPTDAPLAVVGLSMGAIVAAEMATIEPTRVASLALLDTNLDAIDAEQVARRTRWADRVSAGELAAVVDEELVAPLTSDPATHGPLIAEMATRAGADVFLRQNAALMIRHDRRPALETLRIPILVACGGEDQLCPPEIHRDLAGRLGTDPVVVDGAGHLSTVDRPEELTQVLDGWLNTCHDTNHHLTGGTTHEHTTV